jgi:hypothetical protein
MYSRREYRMQSPRNDRGRRESDFQMTIWQVKELHQWISCGIIDGIMVHAEELAILDRPDGRIGLFGFERLVPVVTR